jgi:DNA-binding CsgD family transcriptional regulator
MENNKEKLFVGLTLLFIGLFIFVDVVSDIREGSSTWHLYLEIFAGLLSVFGVGFLLKDSFKTKNILKKERLEFSQFKHDADKWKEQSAKYLLGLSQSIDSQLASWGLSNAEKEVAFLLLKGFSIKEIAEIRSTSEKTVRVQSTAIYSKSCLSGRSELAAFFLEDLLVPSEKKDL